MKVTALKEHICYCCGSAIRKGETCFAFIVNPKDADRNEFDILYTCSRCVDEETCRTRIKKKGAIISG